MKKIIIVIAVAALLVSCAFAQKLPSVQKVSFFAPTNIKIDGKANEWHDQFQAYNNATDIFYTIANDNENLYFAIRAKYQDIIQKIVMGGITVTINPTNKKRDPAAMSITYPVLHDNDMSAVSNMVARKFNPRINGDTSSVIRVDDLNQLILNRSKQINTTGIKAIEDNTISVYNDVGLKAAELFDDKLQYTCEMAVPLKFLALQANQPFSYQIKVNEPVPFKPTPTTGGKLPPPVPVSTPTLATTDFWGEYTLAKK